MTTVKDRFIYVQSSTEGEVAPITNKNGLKAGDTVLYWKETEKGYAKAKTLVGSRGSFFFERDNDLGVLEYDWRSNCWICIGILKKDTLKDIVELRQDK